MVIKHPPKDPKNVDFLRKIGYDRSNNNKQQPLGRKSRLMSFSNPSLGITIDARLANQQEADELLQTITDYLNEHRDIIQKNQEDIDPGEASTYGPHKDPVDNLIDYLTHAYIEITEIFTEDIWDIPGTNRQFMLVASLGDPDSADQYDRAHAITKVAELLPSFGSALGIFGFGIKVGPLDVF